MTDTTPVYVSITGLELKAMWHAPRFWRLAGPAMSAARAAPGNIKATARTIAGVHHTLSVWDSEASMRAYVRSPVHAAAIRAFPKIATGKTIGFWADAPPAWDQARARWEAEARPYQPPG